MMIQRVSSQRYYQTMGNDTGRMPAAANDGSGGSTAGGSPDAAPYATPSFAHGIVPFDHEISSNQHLTFSYAEQSFASANIPWDPDHDALHLKERGMFTNTALIISDQCPFTIKCATFDGDVKAPISERIELSGSMIRQLNDAMTFLNGHNRRDDGRQCPPDALREALVNAVLHRDYAFPGPTLVNIFPSRVEIVSLGGLMDGIEINDLLNGISQPRNPRLAELFTRLGFSENYGTGIRRIMEEYDERQPADPRGHVLGGDGAAVAVAAVAGWIAHARRRHKGRLRTRRRRARRRPRPREDVRIPHHHDDGHQRSDRGSGRHTRHRVRPRAPVERVGAAHVAAHRAGTHRISRGNRPTAAERRTDARRSDPALHRTGRRAVEPPADSRQSRRDQEPDDVRAASSGRAGSGPQTRQIPGHALQHALTRAPAETPPPKIQFPFICAPTAGSHPLNSAQ